jgi:hypothetical protein
MPRAPAIFARPEQLDRAEAGIDVPALLRMGLEMTSVKNFKFEQGSVTSREGLSRRFEKLLPTPRAVLDSGHLSRQVDPRLRGGDVLPQN